ncbi:uncharacterized protein [Pagrus major]|uniref:uncharacterized protein n=1 Tax=Pagrus major TaxID=143350 RepID=UPI003CC84138
MTWLLTLLTLGLAIAAVLPEIVEPGPSSVIGLDPPELSTMAQYITHLAVSIDECDEQHLQSQDYKKIDVDLNKGAGGNDIFLWYKRGSQNPVTRVQVTYNDVMAHGLTSAGYTMIDKDLNAGAGGDYIYLWYYRGSGEFHTPIVDIDVATSAESDADKISHGWEGVTCDLNRKARGNWIHAWVKREHQTYISEVTATDSYALDAEYLNTGYIRMDEDTNRGAGGSDVFIWYRQTTDPQRALTDLAVSTNRDQYQYFQVQSYHLVNVNLNDRAKGNTVYLWSRKVQGDNPIKAIILLLQCDKAGVYGRKGVTVIEKDLNTGNDGQREYLCYYQ